MTPSSGSASTVPDMRLQLPGNVRKAASESCRSQRESSGGAPARRCCLEPKRVVGAQGSRFTTAAFFSPSYLPSAFSLPRRADKLNGRQSNRCEPAKPHRPDPTRHPRPTARRCQPVPADSAHRIATRRRAPTPARGRIRTYRPGRPRAQNTRRFGSFVSPWPAARAN